MKKLLSLILALSMLLTLALTACTGNSQNDKKDDQKEEENELSKEEKKLLDDIVNRMNGSYFSFDDFIDDFFGDFSIAKFDASSGIVDMFKKDGFVVTTRTNNEALYQTLKGEDLYTALRSTDGAKLHLESKEHWPYAYPLSIFTAFGVDMSGIYSTDEPEVEEPELTVDDISLSDDKKTAVFSDEYVKAFAKTLTVSMDLTKTETENFLSTMDASGEYSVSEETFKLSIEGEVKSKGIIKAIVSYGFLNGVPDFAEMEISMEKDDTLASMKMLQDIIKIEDGKLVAVTMKSTQTVVQTVVSQGIPVKTTSVKTSTYNFATENGKPSMVTVEVNADSTAEYAGQKQTGNSSLTFYVIDGNLTYDLSSNGKQQAYIAAEGVVFGTPEGKTIPSDVNSVIK